MKKWFTLVEMLIVVVIIWILASALIPRLIGAQSQARDVARKKWMSDINTAIVLYYNDNGKDLNWDCSYHLNWDYKNIPWVRWYWTTWFDNQNLVKLWYISDVPKDPQKSKKNPMVWSNWYCEWYYWYKILSDNVWDKNWGSNKELPPAWFLLMASMENLKNDNFLLPTPQTFVPNADKPVYFNRWDAPNVIKYINENKCNWLTKWSWSCQTDNVNSWVYLFLWYPSAN